MEGQGLTAYALILVLAAVVVIAALAVLGTSIRATYCRILDELPFDGSTCNSEAAAFNFSPSGNPLAAPHGTSAPISDLILV